MTEISIVIVNWNGGRDTVDCLQSLSKLHIKSFSLEIVVVDNASTDDSLERISKILPLQAVKVHLIRNKENLGFTGGNNAGIEYAYNNNAQFTLLLNNDTTVHPDLLLSLIDADRKNNAIIGPKIYFTPQYEYHKDKYEPTERGKVIWFAGGLIDWNNIYTSHRGVDEVDHGQYNIMQETSFVSGCCMLIPRSIIDSIRLLDDKYFMYFEDVDYCIRAKQNNFQVLYQPQGIIWHKNAQSSGKSGSTLHEYYQTRNRMLFGMQYAPFRTRLALIKESIKFMAKGGVKKKAVVDFYLRRFGKQYAL